MAMALDCNFSISMHVVRSQTNCFISKTKCAIGLKLADGLDLMLDKENLATKVLSNFHFMIH